MNRTGIRRSSSAALGSWVILVSLGGCGQPDPPPDVLKTQREALEKAKGVEATLEKADQAGRKKADADSQ